VNRTDCKLTSWFAVRVVNPATKETNMDYEGYCVKCKTKRQVKNGKVEKTASGKPIAKGKCPVCGTTVTRFLSEKEVK
jgi:hypothetical protein